MNPGAIILTRNTDEVGNESPGYWNHATIYCGNEVIVEAQAEPNAVIAVNFKEFHERYPHYMIMEYPDFTIGMKAAIAAYDSIGSPYWRAASIWPRLRPVTRGENCVSVCRRAWNKAGISNRWKIPDDIGYDNRFDMTYIHVDPSWEKPDEWFKGRLQ